MSSFACPQCATALPAGAAFCPQCGTRFDRASNVAPQGYVPQPTPSPAPMGQYGQVAPQPPQTPYHAQPTPMPAQPATYGKVNPAQLGIQKGDGSGLVPLPGHGTGARPAPARTVALQSFTPQQLAFVTMGRDPQNSIAFEGPDVSMRHARIMLDPAGGLVIEDLGSTNGTYVNGVRVQRQAITFVDDVRLATAPVRTGDPRIAGLLVKINRRPPRGQPINLGTDERCDVVLHFPNIAPHHATITEISADALMVKDAGSQFGTCIDTPGYRISEAKVPATSVLILGSFPLPLPLLGRLLDEHEGVGRASIDLGEALKALHLEKQVFTIGREEGADLVIPHPTISSSHARITRRPDGTLQVDDLGSTNGTYINGERIRSGIAKPGDTVTVGGVSLAIGAGGDIAGAQRAAVRIDMVQLSLVVKDRGSGQPRALLDNVSMSIFSSELVGMLGPSGAGKTTLLMTVLGLNRPTQGGVLVNGQPLFKQYEAFRTNVGYVPQDDIVHPELTVREALYYACRLRLPAGVSKNAINHSIDQTLKQVGLWEQRDLQIGSPEDKVLSGGQRRRVNLAVELVTDPALLILDEPTSGLSWSDAADVVATLRRLADDGRTVCMTIHQPDYQEYEKFDNVAILGRGGKLLFYGPPSPDSYDFFGAEPSKPRQMFDHVEQMDANEWRGRFHQTETFKRFVIQRSPQGEAAHHQPPPKPRPRSSIRQLPVLLGRSLKLTLRNRAALILLLLQAPLLGALVGLAVGEGTTFQAPMFGCMDSDGSVDSCAGVDDKLACDPQVRMAALTAAHQTLDDQITTRIPDPRTGLIAILMALFLPMIVASSNVLVGERTIWKRERLAGLNIAPYVLSRFGVLCMLGTVVAALHLAVAVPLLGLHGGFGDYFFIGVLTTWCASAIGMALSAAVKKPVSALWGINLLVIPQLLFAGSIVKLEGLTWGISWFTTTRYGLEALTNVDIRNRPELSTCQVERYMENLPGFATDMTQWQAVMFGGLGIGGMTLVCIILTMLLLKMKD